MWLWEWGFHKLSFQLICGFLQIYFYKMQRDNPEKWKCQPHHFLTASNELHEIIIGTTNMTIGGALSELLTCWIINGNNAIFYYQLDEYGYLYLVLSFVMVYFWIDGVSFYYHKLMHTSLLYKHLHIALTHAHFSRSATLPTLVYGATSCT